MKHHYHVWTPVALCLMVSLCHVIASQASTTYYVASNADAGSGSLRVAIGMALDGDAVVLQTAGPIRLQTSLTIATSLSIQGVPARTGIDGSAIGDGTVIRVLPGVSVTLNSLEIFGNSTYANGGGITVSGGEAVLESCVIRDNEGTDFGSGGGVHVTDSGRVTLTDCLVTGNRGSYGGGICMWAGTLTLIRTDVTGNSAIHSGGGVFVYLGDMDAEDCTISRNTAEFGGGIYHRSEGLESAIRRCTISGNTATLLGGGLLCGNTGLTTVEDSVISGNTCLGDGGGVHTDADLRIHDTEVVNNSCSGSGGAFNVGDSVLIEHCTIRGNTAGESAGGINAHGWIHVESCLIEDNVANLGGGGIRNVHGVLDVSATTIADNTATRGGGLEEVQGTVTLSNCTVSGNEALEDGGGIWNSGWAYIENCTIAANVSASGGGISNSAYVPIKNSIVAMNDATTGSDVLGELRSQGWNLIGDTAQCQGVFLPSDKLDVDPVLGALSDTGSCMPTHSLLPASPAIDAGSCFGIDGTPIVVDQCGSLRPVGVACDIGAIESPYSTILIPEPPDGLSVTAISDTQIALIWNDNSDNETGFKVERKPQGGTYSQIAVVGVDITGYSDTGLSAATTYCYRVRAYNSMGDSGYSNESCGTRPLSGDINGDGVVDLLDVRLCLEIAQGHLLGTSTQRDRADVDADGDVDMEDAQVLAEYVLGLLPSLPGGGG